MQTYSKVGCGSTRGQTHKNLQPRPLFYRFRSLPDLLAHYDSGNTHLIESLVKSTGYYFARRRKPNRIDTTALKFITQIVIKDRHDRKELLASFKKELLAIKTDPGHEIRLHSFDILAWLDSKIESRPFAEIVRAKAGMT